MQIQTEVDFFSVFVDDNKQYTDTENTLTPTDQTGPDQTDLISFAHFGSKHPIQIRMQRI